MAHDAHARHAALVLLLLLQACGDGGDEQASQQEIPPSSSPPPSPSPSQSVVYQTFAFDGDSNLLTVSEDGSAEVSLAATDRREHFRGISPDGWVVYEREGSEQESQLVSVRITGGETRVLDDAGAGALFRGFTPDNRVVYQKATPTGSAIHSIRPDGTAPAVLIDAPYVAAEFVGATASGRVLYQTCELPQDPQAEPECLSAGLYSVAPDGTDARLLVSATPRVALLTGERAIYEVDAGGQRDLYAVDAGTGAVATLADSPDDERDPRLLPDGRLLYGREVAGQSDVYVVHEDGTGSRALLTDPEDEFVTGVLPSGRILFVRGPSASRNLYAIDPDGTHLAVLGDSPDDENLRHVSAAGRVIYSSRRVAGGFAQDDLYSVAPDGTDLRVLADSPDFEWFEDLAPDGRVIYTRCVAAPSGPCGDPVAQSDLYSVHQNGAGTRTLAATNDFEIYRGITATSRVIYERVVGVQHDIHGIASDGTDPRALAVTPLDERFQGLH